MPGTGTEGAEILVFFEVEPILHFLVNQGQGEHPGIQNSERKKPTPSALQRNQRRKEAFLKQKAELKESEQEPDEEVPKEVDVPFRCDQCENTYKFEKGLKIHIGKSHKDSSQQDIENLRSSNPELPHLSVSPAKDALRSNVGAVER